MTRRLGTATLVATVALACAPELEPIRWDEIDIDALHEAIANPTGIVDEASANEVAAEIVRNQGAYRSLSSYLHQVFLADETGDAGPVWVMPQALGGTSVYLLVACPGPLASDDPPFSRGSMRIDSPTLDAEVVSTFAVEGQLQLSFDGCEIEDYVFDGVAPAFHSSDPVELGYVPALDVVDLAAPEGSFELTEPVVWDPLEGGSALFELDDGTTLTLDWIPAAVELTLRGRNGALVCTIEGDELVCVPP